MKSVNTYKEDFISYLNEKVKVKEPVNLYEPIHYILQIGGKRLRPVLTLMTCDLFGGNVRKAYDAALAVEVFHNFTLIHDDIMDSAPARRGKETVHTKWDVNTGILSGDAMMIVAYQCLESYDVSIFKELMVLLSKTALEVCEGQQLDVDFETRNDVEIPEYIHMITNKTSVLVGAAMKMGAIIAEIEASEAQKIYDFGLNLGVAFQLQDDYLDTFGNYEDFGKQIGGDIIENKKTFLYLKALEVCDDNDKQQLISLYNSKEKSPNKVSQVTGIFNKYNIAQLTSDVMEFYSNKAFKVLETSSISEDNKLYLRNFGLNLMKRKA
jgi:geranylgeranyl diphosphate synthase type II